MVMKMLLVLDAANSHSAKTIMQFPGRRRGDAAGNGSEITRACHGRSQRRRGSRQRIRDGAGKKFHSGTLPRKGRIKRSWVSKGAGPYGLVKHQGKDSTMVLTKVSLITKTESPAHLSRSIR